VHLDTGEVDELPFDEVSSVAFDRAGTSLLTVSYDFLRVWDPTS
jgi:hypothetical protein